MPNLTFSSNNCFYPFCSINSHEKYRCKKQDAELQGHQAEERAAGHNEEGRRIYRGRDRAAA
jgi:hypothetical protein